MSAWNGPLEGVRLADFCWWGVGALCTRMLADFGAQVIKIEDRERLDLLRTVPPYPGEAKALGQVTGRPNVDLSGFFNNHNRNKLSIVLNMRTEKGRDLCRRLIAVSDVVSENFRPGVMERWGLTYDELKRIKPDIIFARLSGLGHTGPEAPYGTAGPIVQALCGLSWMGGLPDMEPSGWGYSYMDNTAGYYGTMAIMMALYHRNLTGEGQEVSGSAVEEGINLLGPDLLDVTANNRTSRRDGMPPGNRYTYRPAAPHGVYPTNEPDRWIAIAVFSDEEWRGLVSLMGEPEWTKEPRFAGLEERVEHQDDLDELVARWTRGEERYALMERLQAAGVPAGVVQTGEDRLTRDPLAKAHGMFTEVDHPVIGRYAVEGVPFTMSDSPPREDWTAAPCLGQHTEYVLTEILGLGSAEVKALADEGVI